MYLPQLSRKAESWEKPLKPQNIMFGASKSGGEAGLTTASLEITATRITLDLSKLVLLLNVALAVILKG